MREQAGGAYYVASEVLDRMSDSPLFEWLASRELDELPAGAGRPRPPAGGPGPRARPARRWTGVLAAMERDLADLFPLDAQVGI